MRYRKLDAADDYTLGTGADFFKDSPVTVAQAVYTRLKLMLAEWFADTSDGTPWFQDVLGKYTQAQYDAVVRRRILETPGVRAIMRYQSAYDGEQRMLVQSATIDTIYGQITVSLAADFPTPNPPPGNLVTVRGAQVYDRGIPVTD